MLFDSANTVMKEQIDIADLQQSGSTGLVL
jgi:hypothetical protein